MFHPAITTFAIHGLIIIAIGARVIMKRPAPGVAMSWMLLVTTLPFAGAIFYLLIGERRISFRRRRAIGLFRSDVKALSQTEIHESLTEIDWSHLPTAAQGMDRLGRMIGGSPTVHGSTLQLYADTQEILEAMAADIGRAQVSILMEFYIWCEGGAADTILEALIAAARRGVACRVLVDALGARPWWKGDQPQRLRDAGVELRPALPVGLLRSFVGRTDLRLHRKIVAIDGEVAWTGSMNLVDPRYFKLDAGVGQWVDAMVRARGAVVAPLALTTISDWLLETGESDRVLEESAHLRFVRPRGDCDIQVIPSGPGESGDGLLQMVLALINSARRELVLTTPYLVPDESVLRALRGAAGRGVRVVLILPEKVDSLLTRYASRSYYDDLLGLGVEIQLYRGGLLHTKSIMADGDISMFGTVNLDMRSLWLNYEVALFVYGAAFAADLGALQQTYLAGSERLDPAIWARRPITHRFVENALRLVGPLL